jgi:hypothetical protein
MVVLAESCMGFSKEGSSDRLAAHHAREQDVVLKLDVLVQIGFEALQIEVQASPGLAGVGGQGEVVGERARALEVGHVVFVLGHHHLDGHEGAATAAGEDEREEDLFFLGQVALDREQDLFQVVGQADRTQGLRTCLCLDQPSAADQTGRSRRRGS